MKTTLVLFGFFLALVQCHVSELKKAESGHSEDKPVPKPEPIPGEMQNCKPTDACSGNGGYCIANSKKKDCDGLLFPNECRSALCSCCVQVKKNECAAGTDTCPANSECQDKEAGYECACNAGFEQCGDINECDSYPCGPNMRCQNTPGSYDCVCNSGFEIVNGTCVDINECASATNPCGPNSVCSNSPPGSFSCNCNAGFVFRDGTCVDNNECDSNPCPANSLCQNTDGSYQCTCATGFTNQTGSCVDVNECASIPPPCSDLQRCINSPGSYSCECYRCSPHCKNGVFVYDSWCTKSIHYSSRMTYDEANELCKPDNSLVTMGSQGTIDFVASLFLANTNETAWVGQALAQAPHTNNLCPTITNVGTSFVAGGAPCDSKYAYAICFDTRLW